MQGTCRAYTRNCHARVICRSTLLFSFHPTNSQSKKAALADPRLPRLTNSFLNLSNLLLNMFNQLVFLWCRSSNTSDDGSPSKETSESERRPNDTRSLLVLVGVGRGESDRSRVSWEGAKDWSDGGAERHGCEVRRVGWRGWRKDEEVRSEAARGESRMA